MNGEMRVMGPEGDTKVTWDSDAPAEVESARRTFSDLRKKGYLGFKVVGKTGEKGEQISEFDPDAERLIMTPPMRGG